MNTKNNAVNLAEALTLTEAVIEAVNDLKLNGSFSDLDITKWIRDAVNGGEFSLPGFEAVANTDGIKYWVENDDVVRVLDTLFNNGELANLGLTDVDNSGTFRVFNFTEDEAATDAATDEANTAVQTENDTLSPVEQRIKAYIDKVGVATLKQVQSALKVNGITCKDLNDMVLSLGYTVDKGTEGAFSTYTVE